MTEAPYDFRRERYEALNYRDPRTGLYDLDPDEPTLSDVEHDTDHPTPDTDSEEQP